MSKHWPAFAGLGLLALAYYAGTRPVSAKRVIRAAAPVDYAAPGRVKPREDKPLVEDRARQIEDYAAANPPPARQPSGTGTGYDTLGQHPSGL